MINSKIKLLILKKRNGIKNPSKNSEIPTSPIEIFFYPIFTSWIKRFYVQPLYKFQKFYEGFAESAQEACLAIEVKVGLTQLSQFNILPSLLSLN